MAKNKKRKLSSATKSSSSADPTTSPSPAADVPDPTPTPSAAVEVTDPIPDPIPSTDVTEPTPDAEPEEEDVEDEDDSNPDAAAAAAAAAAAEENDPESIQKLLEPFSKDQLLALLRDAAVNHADVFKSIQSIADADSAHRKIFVHGLGWDTNTDTLRSAFEQFGEIEDCKAVIDKATGKSKGYGFILFKHRVGAQRALKEPQKKIGNRMTACQLASAGPVPANPPPPVAAPPESEHTLRKIFVSNVGSDIDPQKLLKFFAEFGEIEEGPLGLDKATGKPKGFALFVYKSVESAKKALVEPHKTFEGHVLHCQKAIDGPKSSKAGFQFQGSSSGYQPGGISGQYPKSDRTRSAMAGSGHLMAPPAAAMNFNQTAQFPAGVGAGMNPALGALNALLTQGTGGLGYLAGIGSTVAGGPVANPGVAGQLMNSSGSYGNQVPGVAANMGNGMMGGYGAMQGGYASVPAGRGAGRNQYGLGQMGGMKPYRGQ